MVLDLVVQAEIEYVDFEKDFFNDISYKFLKVNCHGGNRRAFHGSVTYDDRN